MKQSERSPWLKLWRSAGRHVFVTSDKPFEAGDVAAAIGDGTRLDSYVPTAAEATAWEKLVGVAVQPGWTLLDALWATLTSEADPDGLTRAKPIMPTHKGELNLHLGGHSLIRSEKLPADPTKHPAWPNIQRVLQNGYRKIHAHDRTLARKWLGAEQRKYRLSPERARDLLIPADLPRELPLKPTTTLTDDFNRADTTGAEGLGTGAEGWSWVDVSGGGWSITSNRAEQSGSSWRGVRTSDALSSDDHEVTVTHYVSNRLCGPTVRNNTAHITEGAEFYWGHSETSERAIRRKDTTGTFDSTILASDAQSLTFGDPYTVTLTADGTDLILEVEGVGTTTVTDTAYSGPENMLSGLFGVHATGTVDNFEAADLLAEVGEDLVRVAGEAMGLTGARQRLLALARTTAEAEGATETAARMRALARLRSEAVGLTETTASIIEALAEAVVRVVFETVAMAEAVARPRSLARVRAELVGIAGAVARIGGFVSAAVPIITSRIRMRVGPATRMNVPPARR